MILSLIVSVLCAVSPQFPVSNSSRSSAEQHTLFFSTPLICMNCVRLHRRICVFYFYFSACGNLMFFFYLVESKLCKPQLSFLINVLPIKLKAWPSCSVRPNLPGMQTAKKTVFLGEDFGKSQPLKCCHASVVFEYLTGCLKHHLYAHRRLSESHTPICLWRHFQTHTKMQYLD